MRESTVSGTANALTHSCGPIGGLRYGRMTEQPPDSWELAGWAAPSR